MKTSSSHCKPANLNLSFEKSNMTIGTKKNNSILPLSFEKSNVKIGK